MCVFIIHTQLLIFFRRFSLSSQTLGNLLCKKEYVELFRSFSASMPLFRYSFLLIIHGISSVAQLFDEKTVFSTQAISHLIINTLRHERGDLILSSYLKVVLNSGWEL